MPEPDFLPTMLSPNPFPGFFVSSTSKESMMLVVQSTETVPFSLGTQDSSRNTTIVTYLEYYIYTAIII